MQEREELGFEGNTWLFFGDQHFTTDFLYQTEWQEWLEDGTLSKLDIAFSRDTDKKCMCNIKLQKIVNNLIDGLKMALLFMYVVMKVKWQRMFIKRLKCVNQRAKPI